MRRGTKRSAGLITASEIACYAYCPEQWRLEYGLGLPAENQAACVLAPGTMRRTLSPSALAAALELRRVLVVLAVVALLLWLVFSR